MNEVLIRTERDYMRSARERLHSRLHSQGLSKDYLIVSRYEDYLDEVIRTAQQRYRYRFSEPITELIAVVGSLNEIHQETTI